MARALLHRLADQRGTTLVELLVAIPAALILAGAIMALSGVFSDSERANADRTSAIEAQQVALERITRDIRQASAATVPATGQLVLTMPDDGDQVTYDCTQQEDPGDPSSAVRCERTAGAGAVTVLSDAQSVTFTKTGSYIAIRAAVNVPTPTAQPLVVTDGAALRNAPA